MTDLRIIDAAKIKEIIYLIDKAASLASHETWRSITHDTMKIYKMLLDAPLPDEHVAQDGAK